MEFKRNSDGSYFAGFDGSKKDLCKLAQHLKDISLIGVGNNGLALEFQGFAHSFLSAREVFFFAEGITSALEAPFIVKMEHHIKNIVSKVFNLDETFFSSPEDDSPNPE